MAITNETSVNFSFGNNMPSDNIVPGTFYIDSNKGIMGLGVSDSLVLPISSERISCSELGMTEEDENNNNLILLDTAIKQGKKILVDKIYKIKKYYSTLRRYDYLEVWPPFENLETIDILGLGAEVSGFNFDTTAPLNQSFLFQLGSNINTININNLCFNGFTATDTTAYLFGFVETDNTIDLNINQVHIQNCSFKNNIICFQLRPVLSNISINIKSFIFEHNIGQNINLTCARPFVQISGPCQSVIFNNNRFTNFDQTLLCYQKDNALDYDYLFNTQQSCEIKHNTIINEDHVYHKEGVPGNTTDYHCFALVECQKIEYAFNHVEGLKMKPAAIQEDGTVYKCEMYDLYSLCNEVYYHHNIWKNIYKASQSGDYVLMQAKSAFNVNKTNGTRIYSYNQFIIEEDWVQNVFKDEIAELGEDNFFTSSMPRLILTTSNQDFIKIDNNIIKMPVLMGMRTDSNSTVFEFTNNYIDISRFLYYGLLRYGNYIYDGQIFERTTIVTNNTIKIQNYHQSKDNDGNIIVEEPYSYLFKGNGKAPKLFKFADNRVSFPGQMYCFSDNITTDSDFSKIQCINNIFEPFFINNEILDTNNNCIFFNFSGIMKNNIITGTADSLYTILGRPNQMNFECNLVNFNSINSGTEVIALYMDPSRMGEEIGEEIIKSSCLINSINTLEPTLYVSYYTIGKDGEGYYLKIDDDETKFRLNIGEIATIQNDELKIILTATSTLFRIHFYILNTILDGKISIISQKI